MGRQLVAELDLTLDVDDVGEIQRWADATGIEVHRQGQEIDITGTLIITEQRPLDPLGACQGCLLGGRHPSTTIIVRVDADDHAVALAYMAAKPFDLIREHVSGGDFHGGGQVQDHLVGW